MSNKFEDLQARTSGFNQRRKNFINDNNDENHKATLENFKDLLENMDSKIYGGNYMNTPNNQSSQGFNRMNNDFKYRANNTDRGLDN